MDAERQKGREGPAATLSDEVLEPVPSKGISARTLEAARAVQQQHAVRLLRCAASTDQTDARRKDRKK